MQIVCHFEFNSYFGTPQIVVALDDLELHRGNVQAEMEFTVNIVPGAHQFKITHHGKNKNDFNTTNDKHVDLKKLTFDEVDLDQFEHCRLTHRGKFYPDYHPDFIRDSGSAGTYLPKYIQPNHYFGHNGTWVLEFNYPVLLWVIQEQNPSGMHLEDTIFSSSQETINDIKDFFNLDE